MEEDESRVIWICILTYDAGQKSSLRKSRLLLQQRVPPVGDVKHI